MIIKTDEKHTGTPERKWVPGGRIEIPYFFFFFFLYGVKAHEIVFKEKVNNEKEISCFKKHEYSFYSSKPL